MTTQATSPAAGGAVIPPEIVDPAAVAPQGSEPLKEGETEKTPEQLEAEKKSPEGNGEERPQVTRAQLRIREVIRERNNFRNERDQLASRLARLEKPLAADRENLEYDDRERLRTREALREERKEELQEQVQIADANSKGATANAVALMLEEAADPALEPILNDPSFPITDDVMEFLADTDQAVSIAKHLAQNPQLARKLAEMTFRGNSKHRGSATRQSMREADRILLQLEARFKSGPTTQGRTATKAPAPGTTLNGGAPPKTVVPLHEVNDNEEYIARRRAAWAKGQP